jgi:hypothetical protein
MIAITRSALAAPVLALVTLAATPSVAKDGVGVYALIDRVVFEPDPGNPERVQLWGIFRVADTFRIEDGKLTRITLTGFQPVARGHMYFELNPDHPAETRSEWRQIARQAGTGRPIAFGARVPGMEREIPLAGRFDATAMNDTAYIGWMIRYNGRVRTAVAEPSDPDVYPMRMGPNVQPLVVSRTTPAVLPLLSWAARPGR